MSDDKKSWRERDRKNDSSSHTRSEGRGRAPQRSGMSRAQADKLFESGKLAEVYEKRFGKDTSPDGLRLEQLRALKKAEGAKFVKGLQAFMAEHGFPADVDVARRAVEVDNLSLVCEALAALCDIAGRAEIPRKAALKVHLDTLEMLYEGSAADPLIARLRGLL